MGWNLPPGCGRLPGDEPEPPCSLCGMSVDDCKCPPCEQCEAHGCIEHIPLEQLYLRFAEAGVELRKRGYSTEESRIWEIVHDLDGCERSYGAEECSLCDSRKAKAATP